MGLCESLEYIPVELEIQGIKGRVNIEYGASTTLRSVAHESTVHEKQADGHLTLLENSDELSVIVIHRFAIHGNMKVYMLKDVEFKKIRVPYSESGTFPHKATVQDLGQEVLQLGFYCSPTWIATTLNTQADHLRRQIDHELVGQELVMWDVNTTWNMLLQWLGHVLQIKYPALWITVADKQTNTADEFLPRHVCCKPDLESCFNYRTGIYPVRQWVHDLDREVLEHLEGLAAGNAPKVVR